MDSLIYQTKNISLCAHLSIQLILYKYWHQRMNNEHYFFPHLRLEPCGELS